MIQPIRNVACRQCGSEECSVHEHPPTARTVGCAVESVVLHLANYLPAAARDTACSGCIDKVGFCGDHGCRNIRYTVETPRRCTGLREFARRITCAMRFML